MTITVTSAQCVQPEGELFAELFPNSNLDDLVSGWLAKASDEITALNIVSTYQDAAALAYVYWRAYDHICLRMANEFASKTVHSGAGDATLSQTNDQRKFFQDRAQYYRDRFQFNSPLPSDTVSVFFGGCSSARFNGEL
jgi:hypothetical protein